MTTWTIVGTTLHTAPVASCQHCGQDHVRRIIRVTDGTREMSVGDTCAARLAGLPVREARARAAAADMAREAEIDATWMAWSTERVRIHLSAYNRTWDLARANAAQAAWDAEYPEPPRPERVRRLAPLGR